MACPNLSKTLKLYYIFITIYLKCTVHLINYQLNILGKKQNYFLMHRPKYIICKCRLKGKRWQKCKPSLSTYITVLDYQVRSVVLVIVCLKEGEVRVHHAAIVKTMTQS
jgi:hypothetical protein